MRPLKCFFGMHDIPANGITEYYGAVWKGGDCPNCDRTIRGKFLFNAWDDSKTEETETAVRLNGTNPELAEGLESGKYEWA